MLRGEAVRVCRPSPGAADPFGRPAAEYDWDGSDTAENVLVAPGPTADLDATRPEGAQVAYSLYFPKSYAEPLKGCRVEVAGGEFEVVGDPRAYPAHLTPGEWNRVAEVRRVDG